MSVALSECRFGASVDLRTKGSTAADSAIVKVRKDMTDGR